MMYSNFQIQEIIWKNYIYFFVIETLRVCINTKIKEPFNYVLPLKNGITFQFVYYSADEG